MSENQEMDKFIIENMLYIEKAQELLTNIDDELFDKICKFIIKKLDGQNVFISQANDDIKFGKASWHSDENDDEIAYFYLHCQGEEAEEGTWLGILCGLYPGSSGGLALEYCWWLRRLSKKVWKKFLKDFFINHPELNEKGFSLSMDGTAILKPIHLDQNCLANNFANADQCFQPVADALDSIISSAETFDLLIREAEKLQK